MTFDPEGNAVPCYFFLLPTPSARAGDKVSSCLNPVNFGPSNSPVKTVSTESQKKQLEGPNVASERWHRS